MQTATASVSNLEENSVTTDVQVIFDSETQRTDVNEALCAGHKNVFVEAICSPVICADLNNQNCKFVSKQNNIGLNLADKSTDGKLSKY